MSEINTPAKGTVPYEVTMLDDENKKSADGSVCGIIIEGITVRVDDLYFTPAESEGGDAEMRVEYKLVDGIPENIEDFESKLSNVMVQMVDEHNQSDNETK